jgi:hypothetical protein
VATVADLDKQEYYDDENGDADDVDDAIISSWLWPSRENTLQTKQSLFFIIAGHNKMHHRGKKCIRTLEDPIRRYFRRKHSKRQVQGRGNREQRVVDCKYGLGIHG